MLYPSYRPLADAVVRVGPCAQIEALEPRQLLSAGVFAFGVDAGGNPASSTVSYLEDAGTVRIPVKRVGGTVGAVSVDYASAGGSRTPSNFQHVQGTLNFADGQDTAYIDLPLVDDAISQNTQRVVLSLSGALGGGVMSPTTGTVFVLDNEPTASTLVVAPDAGGRGDKPVTVLDAQGNLKFTFYPYGRGYKNGVRVALGDFNGDSVADIVTAPASGGGKFTGTAVKVFDGVTGGQLQTAIGSVLPYGSDYRGGVFVSAGDLDGDGVADLITSADRGWAAHVKVFSGADGREIYSLMPFESTAKTGGRVAFGYGQVDTLGPVPVLVVGAGPGAGQLSVFTPSGGQLQRVANFYPFGPRATCGMYVGASNNTDALVVTATPAASGRGWCRDVKTYDLGGLGTGSLIAFGPGYRGATHTEMGDYNGDGVSDFVLGPAAGPPARLRVLSGADQQPLADLLPYGKKHKNGLYAAIDDDHDLAIARQYLAPAT